MWILQPESEYKKQAGKWPPKHQREYGAVHNNLDTFLKALQLGAKLEQVKFGFVHREPRGIVAIDQKGGGQGLKETRLYIYPNKAAQIIHVVTIGDKSSQKADIKYTCEFVDSLSTTTQ
jgi:hypothetical protein